MIKENKCCFKNENEIDLVPGWSYVCKICGRYTYDYDGNQVSKKDSYQKILNLLEEYGLDKRGMIDCSILTERKIKKINYE